MTAHKIAIKLFAASHDIHEETFGPVVHRWIQGQSLADHMLIDVADYGHVPNGPGTVLVSHEANIYADREGGRLGLLYTRKQPGSGGFAERLRQALSATLKIAAMLEAEPEFEGKLTFGTGEIVVRINDRLLAPNTPATFAAVRNDIETIATDLFGGAAVTLEHDASPVSVFTVTVKAEGSPPAVSALAERFSTVGA